MVLSPKLTATKKTALLMLLVTLTAPCILRIHPVKTESKTITAPDGYPTIVTAIDKAIEDDTDISNINLTFHNPFMVPLNIDSVAVEPPNSVSPSPTPTPSPTPKTPRTDLKPLPTTLLMAVAILAIVFGFGLIVNLVAGKKKKN